MHIYMHACIHDARTLHHATVHPGIHASMHLCIHPSIFQLCMCHVSTVQAKNRLLVQKYKEDKDEEEEEEEEENKQGREEKENEETRFPLRDHDFDRIFGSKTCVNIYVDVHL